MYLCEDEMYLCEDEMYLCEWEVCGKVKAAQLGEGTVDEGES